MACDSDSRTCAFLDTQGLVITRPPRSNGSPEEIHIGADPPALKYGCFLNSNILVDVRHLTFRPP